MAYGHAYYGSISYDDIEAPVPQEVMIQVAVHLNPGLQIRKDS